MVERGSVSRSVDDRSRHGRRFTLSGWSPGTSWIEGMSWHTNAALRVKW